MILPSNPFDEQRKWRSSPIMGSGERKFLVPHEREGGEGQCNFQVAYICGEHWWCKVTCATSVFLQLNVFWGNMWFSDWVFAGMILSFLKLGRELLIVHGDFPLDFSERSCAQKDDWDCIFMRCIRIQCFDSCVLRWTICAAFCVCEFVWTIHGGVLLWTCVACCYFSTSEESKACSASFSMSLLWTNSVCRDEIELIGIVTRVWEIIRGWRFQWAINH